MDARERKIGSILRQGIDATGFKRVVELLGVLDNDRLEGLLSFAEEVGDIELAGRTRLDADRGTVQIRCLLNAKRLLHEDTLTILEDGRSEMESKLEGAYRGHGDARQQHVELAGL